MSLNVTNAVNSIVNRMISGHDMPKETRDSIRESWTKIIDELFKHFGGGTAGIMDAVLKNSGADVVSEVSGTQTFTYVGGATSFSCSGITSQSCGYTKLGKIVKISGRITLNITAGVPSSADYIVLSGLPYTPVNYWTGSHNQFVGHFHIYNDYDAPNSAWGIIMCNSSNQLELFIQNVMGTMSATDPWFIDISYLTA